MKKIFIATPCYGGMVTTKYMGSLLQAYTELPQSGVGVYLSTVINESLITRARNNMVADFLETDATHLFFIDADMTFTTLDILNILNADQDVVGGACPTKTIAKENFVNKNFETIKDVEKAMSKYALNFDYKDDKTQAIKTSNNLIEMKHIGTAFMCIKREVIEKMIEEYKDSEHINVEGKKVYNLFDTMIYNKEYLSEDYAFCHKWREMGGIVYLHPDVAIDHFGAYNFKAVPVREYLSN